MNALTTSTLGGVTLAIVLSRQFSAPRRGPEAICRRRPRILRSPTILGRRPGHLTSHLVPPHSVTVFNVRSQVAVVPLMFVADYELRL